jgi:3-dehydroquinate dehydratase/shikimate dehydrogenase
MAVISGVEMFVHQGARQFEIWTGKPAPINEMHQVVVTELQNRAAAQKAQPAHAPEKKAPAKAKKAKR